MEDVLKRHKDIWNKKKILRIIYSDWYKKIISDLRQGNGLTVELGSGSGNFKEFRPDVISSDVDPCEWLDMCFDAHSMPFKEGSVSNVVMIDVFHHLSDPVKFLHECERVLKKGGRIIMLEPFPSLFSLIIYRLFHPEPFLMNIDYFNKKEKNKEKNPWNSNQAIPYLIFFKQLNEWKKEFQQKLRLIKRQKLSFILYPLSGGFENKSLIPDFLVPVFMFIEKMLYPFRRILAFRCYIVVERK